MLPRTFGRLSVGLLPVIDSGIVENLQSNMTVNGCLEHITYYNEANCFAIAKMRIDKTRSLITVLGYLPDPVLGEDLTLKGLWESHPVYGQQFRFESHEVVLPATVGGIRQYLASGCIKGVGPKMAERLVHHFNDRTLAIIENEPERLTEVEGIGPSKAEWIKTAWNEHHSMRHLMNVLKKAGVKASYGAKILSKYGSDAMSVIQADPYRLTGDFPRVGLYMADALVRSAGADADDEKRSEACILTVLQEGVENGHGFISEDQMIGKCGRSFGVLPEGVGTALESLSQKHRIVLENLTDPDAPRSIYLPELYEAENGIANRIKAMLSVPGFVDHVDPEWVSKEILAKHAIKLSDEQLDVLRGILAHRIAIITGGPGTGKTTLIKSVTTILSRLGKRILLAAPTGRAARRLSEVAGRKASTIHKLLGFNMAEDRFERNPSNPLDLDALIVDEASMVDLFLMYHLLNAAPVTAMVILVGDVFQLPSVGPGNVLSDLIASKRVKTFELTKIFRQAEKSPIVTNAHRVRRGEPLELPPADESSDLTEFCFIEKFRPIDVVDAIVALCARKIPSCFHLDPVDDIQVLAPMHKGAVGTLNLNRVLQNTLNPKPEGLKSYDFGFSPGDKVIHLKNNYTKEVFNGDIGRVGTVNPAERCLTVDYDGRHVVYDFSELDELMLAYAISVHKSQGSEYPVVIIPMMMQHVALLQRNLLYTAITRAKHLVILIGTRKALHVALKNDTPQRRNTGLSVRLEHFG
jgi:exodeoxyribonuclease V alpha subunit